ncbi:hypothetical protein AZ15_0885 [Bordetella bronchiseptica A1-7]|nr:hypothetical protein AZ15_0885 [Bordetella bronchiseptica A1-7]
MPASQPPTATMITPVVTATDFFIFYALWKCGHATRTGRLYA